MSAGCSDGGRGSEGPTPPPCNVTHHELTTVTMDGACNETSADPDAGGGAQEPLESRDSPGEEEDEDEEDEDEEEEEEEEEEDEDESGDSERVIRKCVYEGCTETTTQVAKPRKPWMCKKHRNKTYKDKYKRRKSVRAMANSNKSDDDTDERPTSVTKQRLSCMIVHQASRKASLLEQVLNQKRLSLLRSLEVIQFLQEQQRLLSNQALAQRQQFQESPM
ncbi:regulatory factor X-associated protein [Pristis pectinata]|uniref:regulatory factor X-associated protein n=1 Tax=Pristis pectinata TaxID=685728 RepID=UPI00223D2212|nr:regulatory factor X-associated protein [Pristis pectinata]